MPIIFPTAHHAFCLQHLQRNLKDKLKYMNNLHKIGLITKFNNCAYALTVYAFENMVGKFTRSGKAIATDFLRDLLPKIGLTLISGATGMARCVPMLPSLLTTGLPRPTTFQ